MAEEGQKTETVGYIPLEKAPKALKGWTEYKTNAKKLGDLRKEVEQAKVQIREALKQRLNLTEILIS